MDNEDGSSVVLYLCIVMLSDLANMSTFFTTTCDFEFGTPACCKNSTCLLAVAWTFPLFLRI